MWGAASFLSTKIWAIGISNFHDHKLEHLLSECEIKPHVIQLEEHPYFSDTKTLNMLAPHGVGLMAWYPLGHGDKLHLGAVSLAK